MKNQDLFAYREAVLKIKDAILQARYRVSANANAEMLNLYYGVGQYISENTRMGKWGTGVMEKISEQLQGEIPGLHGFSPSNMKNMRIFFEQWSSEFEANRQLPTADLESDNNADELLVIRQLPTAELDENKISAFVRVGFTHHREILRKCKTADERWYYILRCADEFWSVARLKHHILANDYASFGSLPNNFAITIPDNETAAIAVRSFRDEYLLDFVDIKEADDYSERDVENAIVADVKKFVMSAGEGFAFIGNQHRLLVDEEEFFVDMLFFNRNLHCLVAFELKKDKFRPSDLGQLSFYLSALDKYVKKPDENNTIGILLCQEMNRTVVELAVQDYDKPMGVATYRLGTEIPEQYKALIPLIDGVQKIVLENGNAENGTE
ncbi:MAG: PDDEXK nuclease domain-containing protein [Oscillospiraceae bacterium]|nr:PDDEXK nuclease domain-containing protein [Oscillospiraceae bacterium]